MVFPLSLTIPSVSYTHLDVYKRQVQIARMLEPKDYIWGYAVATLDEAVVLRKRGIKKPILVLGCIFPDQWEAAITHEIRFTVYTKEMAEGISELAGKLGKDAYVHIKLDTGMSRLGFLIQEESAEIITGITRLPGLIMEGMFTHCLLYTSRCV